MWGLPLVASAGPGTAQSRTTFCPYVSWSLELVSEEVWDEDAGAFVATEGTLRFDDDPSLSPYGHRPVMLVARVLHRTGLYFKQMDGGER